MIRSYAVTRCCDNGQNWPVFVGKPWHVGYLVRSTTDYLNIDIFSSLGQARVVITA